MLLTAQPHRMRDSFAELRTSAASRRAPAQPGKTQYDRSSEIGCRRYRHRGVRMACREELPMISRILGLAGLAAIALILIAVATNPIAIARTTHGVDDITLLVLTVYILPALVAYQRRHRQGLAIFVLTLFTGWTVIGWVGALVWACTDNEVPRVPR
jgi:hypothetical protein